MASSSFVYVPFLNAFSLPPSSSLARYLSRPGRQCLIGFLSLGSIISSVMSSTKHGMSMAIIG